ncbi:MAG: murein hydrolase activator EnvC family protein [Oscillospiraceae bacterium]
MKFFRKHQKKIIAVLALLLALLMILPTITMILSNSAGAVTQKEIDALKEDAAALAQTKKNLNNQLAALEGEINSALSKKLVVEQEINVVEEQIATTTALIAKYDEQIAQEEVNLAEAQEREAQHYEEACQRVRMMEEQGTVTYWQILFGAADFNDLLDRAMMINETAEYDNAVMDALEQARIDVENAKAALESARAEQVDAKTALDAQKAELDAKKATINTLLAELQAKQDQYESKLDKLDSQMTALDDEIAAKQEELRRQIAAGQIQKADTGSGYLWPLDGCYVVTSLFGPRIHPITGKPGNHLGTDIRASYGTPIKAARGGTVITSAYNSSYGNYVVVDHYDGVTTLYAHMSSRSVSAGQAVSQGQELGKVGSTGSSNGNHLHFEVRVNNVRQDAISYYPNLNLWLLYNGQVIPLEH